MEPPKPRSPSRMSRRLIVALCSLAAVLALTGCGERKEVTAPASTKTLRIALAPLNAGEGALFAADNERAGLDVEFKVAADPNAPIAELTQGRADLAVTTEPALLEAR